MYFIVEVQRNADGTCSHLVETAAGREEAESVWHRVLQYAAVSDLPAHGAIVFSEECFPVLHQCYLHPQAQPAAAPEE